MGAEWLIVAGIAGVVYVNGYIQAQKGSGSSVGLGYRRLTIGTTCYVVEVIGAIALMSGHIMGIYVASSAMIINITFMISGAWLLMVGVHHDLNKQQKINE